MLELQNPSRFLSSPRSTTRSFSASNSLNIKSLISWGRTRDEVAAGMLVVLAVGGITTLKRAQLWRSGGACGFAMSPELMEYCLSG